MNEKDFRAEMAQLAAALAERDKIILELCEENKKLQAELAKYKNSNTPPSANKHLKPNTKGKEEKGGKRGAPEGHEGTTRQQTPEEHNVVDAAECPGCHSHNVEDTKVINKTTEEIPEPVAPKVVSNEIHEKKCLDCGLRFIPPQNTVPLKGKFGINLIVFVMLMRFLLRGVLRKTASFLDAGFALKITPATVNAILKRAAEAADAEYGILKRRIRTASRVFVDETSFSVLGVNYWVWIFRTKTDILLVIRPTRGNTVLSEILGLDYSGVVHCDCWRAYDILVHASIQRCWAHLLRKSKELLTVAGRHFHARLKAIHEEIIDFNKTNPTEGDRQKKTAEMTLRLNALLRYYSRYEEIRPVIKYIDNHHDQWLTCLRLSDVETTNNLAEQGIRETVMVRKIIGAFRSEDGSKHYETLASLIASWQLQGLDLQKELRQMLIRNLCLS